jgi:hypothetical protein
MKLFLFSCISMLIAQTALAANCASIRQTPVQCGNGNTTNTFWCRNSAGEFSGVICGSLNGPGPMGIAACCGGTYNPNNFNGRVGVEVKKLR